MVNAKIGAVSKVLEYRFEAIKLKKLN